MDIIDIEVLADGTIKFQTDSISQANHLSADEFLKEMAELTGGEVTIEQKEKGSKARIGKKARAT
jgi:spore cortex formation protein SpoVR/YcgB (stage V sporulation)